MDRQAAGVVGYLRSVFSTDALQHERDSELLRRFVETRSADAFSTIVCRHGAMVLGLARRIVRDYQVAEDVFQATFLVLARKAGAIRGGDALSAWLHSVAVRMALRARKAQDKNRDQNPRISRNGCRDPLDELTAREYLAIIDEELDRLPEKYRLPFILCHLEGLTQEETAERLAWSLGTVKGRLERGRRELRARLTRRGLTVGAGVAAALTCFAPVGALAMPPELVRATTRAAVTGQTKAPTVTALASEAVRLMFLARLRSVVATIALFAIFATGIGWAALTANPAAPAPAFPPDAAPVAQTGQPKNERQDLHGDPLPDGAVQRLGTVQLRAGGATLALRPDGQTLVGLRGGRVLTFWDVQSGKVKETRELPTRSDWGSVLSADGRVVAADDIEIWDVESGKRVQKLPARERIESKAFSRDGKYLAAVLGRNKYTVRVWDLATGKETFSKEIQSEGSNEFVAFTPDGKRLVAAFASADVGTFCWDLTTGEQLWQNKKVGFFHLTPAFSADGTKILNTTQPLDVATGKTLLDEKLPTLEYGNQVLALPDGRTLLVTGPDGVLVWDMERGKEVRRLAGAGEEIVLAPDGKTLISNNGALQRWNLETGKALYADNFDAGHVQEVQAVVFSADGKRLASSAADGSVRSWDLATGRPIHVWPAHEARRPRWMKAGAHCLELTADGRWIASAGTDERIRVWDTESGKAVATISLPEAIPNEHDRAIYHLRLSADAKTITAIFGAGGFSYSTGQPLVEHTDWQATWNLPGGNLRDKLPLKALASRFSGFSRDARLVVRHGKAVKLPSLTEIALEGADNQGGMSAYAISPDGSLVAADFAEVKNNVSRFSEVRIWETATGKAVAHLKTKSWSGELQFHPSNRYLAINDLDGLHVWDIAVAPAKKVATRKLPERIRATTTPGTYSSCFAFSPDGTALATGHTDGTILIWKLDLPQPQPAKLDAKEAAKLWANLKDADASKAWAAVWRLADSPAEALALLRQHLKPAASAPAAETDPLLTDLGSDVFAKREAATKRLKDLGLTAESALRQRLEAKPTLEVRQRVEAILEALEKTPPTLTMDDAQALRSVAVLARINSKESRELLDALTRGAPSAPLTLAARAAQRP
jgi:RNA polymerase sigma factor (sigma-70 family)